jgi:nucleoside-diphosphate-sugar epimerase
MPNFKRVLVTGGAGYVGAVLTPQLLAAGYEVVVYDLYIYGEEALAHCRPHSGLTEVKADIRDTGALRKALTGCDAVIHLACISNDPSFELNPDLGRSINFDAFRPLVKAAKDAGVRRFIYASSSSVYGIKEGIEVTENESCQPLTDYSKFKAMCEEVLDAEREPGFTTLTFRPATVCGFSPRQRLDVIINILTNHAVNNRAIKVFGGDQLRPNIHIADMCDVYLLGLATPDKMIDGKYFNVGFENHAVMELARMVRGVVGDDVAIDVVPTDDHRSYHVSSGKIRKELAFVPRYTIEDAVRGLATAFAEGKLPRSMVDSRYYNIKRMQELHLR